MEASAFLILAGGIYLAARKHLNWRIPVSILLTVAVLSQGVHTIAPERYPDALVRFNPRTETFQSWAIPSGVGIVRNVWVTEAGDLLIHQSSSNQVGLVKID